MNKRIATYSRISTASQNADVQIQECRQYAARCGYEIVGEYTDTISGISTSQERKALTQLLEDAFARKFDAVVVYSIDRVGRSLKNCLEILENLKSLNVGFISITQAIDTNTVTGQFMANIFSCLANYERTQILERTNLGRIAAKARGVKFGRRSNMSESTLQSIRSLRKQGVGIKQIAKSLQVGVGTVYKYA